MCVNHVVSEKKAIQLEMNCAINNHYGHVFLLTVVKMKTIKANQLVPIPKGGKHKSLYKYTILTNIKVLLD